MEMTMDPNRVILIANVLGMWLVFALGAVLYDQIWWRHRYDRVRFKLSTLRDEVDRMAYLEGKLRSGAFLHHFLTYEISAVIQNAERFSFFDCFFDPASEEAWFARKLHSRLQGELNALSDEEVVLRIVRIRSEMLVCARKLWRMNSRLFRMRGGGFSAAQISTAILVKVRAAA